MSSSNLVRWGGVAMLAAGVLFAATALLPDRPPAGAPYSPAEYPFVALPHLPYLLLSGGLVGLGARHAGAYGGAGRAGFRLAFAGYLLEAALGFGATVAEAFTGVALSPTVAGLVGFLISLAFLVGQLGLLLVGVVTLRAGALPMPFKALPLAIFLAGVPPALLVLLVFGLDYVLGAATEAPAWVVAQEASIGLLWALLGWALFSGAGTNARRPATAG